MYTQIEEQQPKRDISKLIYEHIQQIKPGFTSQLSEPQHRLMESLLNQLKANNTILQACTNKPELVESLAMDVYQRVAIWHPNQLNQGAEEGTTDDEEPYDPLQEEIELYEQCLKQTPKVFWASWPAVKPKLHQFYPDGDLDINFYHNEWSRINEQVKALRQKQFQAASKEEKATIEEEINELLEYLVILKKHLMDKWGELLEEKKRKKEEEEQPQRSPKRDKKEKDDGEEEEDENGEDAAAQMMQQMEQQMQQFNQLEDSPVNELAEDTEQLWKLADGTWEESDFNVLEQYSKILRSTTGLDELADILGKARPSEKIFVETTYELGEKIEFPAKSEVVGIKESDDLNNLMPIEVALLGEGMDTLFTKKYLEKGLQTLEYTSFLTGNTKIKKELVQKEVKGPFIICLDTSGSMQGKAEKIAKSLVFAILKLALREERKCYLISFSKKIQSLEISDLNKNMSKLVRFLKHSFNGGTNLNPAIYRAVEMLNTNDYRRADVLLVSDFVMPDFRAETLALIEKAQEEDTQFYGVVMYNPSPIMNRYKKFYEGLLGLSSKKGLISDARRQSQVDADERLNGLVSQNKNVIATFDYSWLYRMDDPKATEKLVEQVRKDLLGVPEEEEEAKV